MSLVTIRKALEVALSDLQQATVNPLDIAVASQNTLYEPIDGTPYLQADFLPAEPDNRTMGGAVWFERGIFQLTLKYPKGRGTADAGLMAERLKDAFARCESLTADGIIVRITGTPRVSPQLPDPTRYCIAVSIPWQAQVAR